RQRGVAGGGGAQVGGGGGQRRVGQGLRQLTPAYFDPAPPRVGHDTGAEDVGVLLEEKRAQRTERNGEEGREIGGGLDVVVEAALFDRLLDQLLAGALEFIDVRRRGAQRRLATRLRVGATAVVEIAVELGDDVRRRRLPRRMAGLAAEVAHQLFPELRPTFDQLVALDARQADRRGGVRFGAPAAQQGRN